MGTAHLLRLLSLITGILMLQQVISWSINVPTTVTAVEGSCVVVPCHTQPHNRVIWYQYHNIHYPVVYDGHHSVEGQFKGRTSVLGKAADGNCTLMINNMKKAENNLKVYVWIDPDSKAAQKFHHQTVTIFVERKDPIISIQKHIVDGEFFQGNCSVKYSCPFLLPSLHWNISLFLENTSTAVNTDVQGQWMYTKTLHGLATYKIHNSEVWCSAKFKTVTTESKKITLNILYEPVTVTLIVEKEAVREGGSVTVECAANCNPQTHTYIWLRRQMGQITEITSTDRKRHFNNITRDTSISCIANNDIGKGKSDWLDLDVQYAPVILPESSCHLKGKVLSCVCHAEASPNASIYWTIDGNDTLPSSFSFVSTHKKNVVSGEVHGPAQSQSNVSCTATNSVGSNIKQLSVYLPKTSSFLLSTLLLLGVSLLLGCAIFIYRKYSGDRQQSVSVNVHQEQRYSSVQRSQDDGTQSSPCRAESSLEEDGLSCVYDNEFLGEMSRPPTGAQQQQNRATTPQAKSLNYNMNTYLNC